MKFVIVGAGPSGLYFALLARERFPAAHIEVHEQNPKDATYGFGIVLAERGLERLRQAHAESYEQIMAASYVTRNRLFSHPRRTLFIEGGGYGGAVARLRLLNILEGSCGRAGIEVHYESRIEHADRFSDADLVLGADGVNSVVRRSYEEGFGTTTWDLSNRLAWYGTRRHFAYPILSFRKHSLGHFVAAAYPYTETMSTFVAECDAATWTESGLAGMDAEQRRAVAEEVFAEELGGESLISNKSDWRPLPVTRNRAWNVGRYVLIGDALHSAHPTIGSGTRIAMEDAIALADALAQHPDDLPAGIALFRKVREPQKQKWVDAAEKSFMWYEGFAQKMDQLEPLDFIFDFMTRTGRVDPERLKAEYPEFMRLYAQGRAESATSAGGKRAATGVGAGR